MEFIWECMMIFWQLVIGFLAWVISIAIAGTIIAKVLDFIRRHAIGGS